MPCLFIVVIGTVGVEVEFFFCASGGVEKNFLESAVGVPKGVPKFVGAEFGNVALAFEFEAKVSGQRGSAEFKGVGREIGVGYESVLNKLGEGLFPNLVGGADGDDPRVEVVGAALGGGAGNGAFVDLGDGCAGGSLLALKGFNSFA